MATWRFESKLFRRGFTFAVALIQNEKIKVKCVAILMEHPVYNDIAEIMQNEIQVAKGTCSFIKPQLPKTKNLTAFR